MEEIYITYPLLTTVYRKSHKKLSFFLEKKPLFKKLGFSKSVFNHQAIKPKNFWGAVCSMLRYLKGNPWTVISYSKKSENLYTLEIHCDYAENRYGKKKNTPSYVLKLENRTIAWCSRKQKVVAQSVIKIDCILLAQCCSDKTAWCSRKPKIMLSLWLHCTCSMLQRD